MGIVVPVLLGDAERASKFLKKKLHLEGVPVGRKSYYEKKSDIERRARMESKRKRIRLTRKDSCLLSFKKPEQI